MSSSRRWLNRSGIFVLALLAIGEAIACGGQPLPKPALPAASVDPAASDPVLATKRARVLSARTAIRARPLSPLERAVVEADLTFADDALARGAGPAFASRFLQDGQLITPGREIAIGPDAVRARFGSSAAKWYWSPVEVAVDGNLAVTRGMAAIEVQDEAGGWKSFETRYVTVWKRGADGAWKIWIDIGNEAPVAS